jgi:ABC-type Fe3+ transport system substrate-binding protein
MLGNGVLLLDGNSQVVKAVGSGRAAVGLTDSDDILAGQRETMPIAAWPLTVDSLVIPNALGMVRGGPNSEAAAQLAAFLQRHAADLVSAGALEGAETTNAGIQPRWDALLDRLPDTNRKLEEIFLR